MYVTMILSASVVVHPDWALSYPNLLHLQIGKVVPHALPGQECGKSLGYVEGSQVRVVFGVVWILCMPL